ncbi:hypothetical protein EV426DRAFT_52234 [Tirmania nivea]|nr:hypothetical protein EV426DRAFT_52234 [Tirmania nivea]
MVKCVNEIIHICEVCIKKEAKRKEAEGSVKAVPARLEGTKARVSGQISIPGVDTNMYSVQEEPMTLASGRKDTGGVPLVEPYTSMSKRENLCNGHQFVGSPFPKTVLVTPQPMGTGLLSQWFGSIKFHDSAKILPYNPEFTLQEPDLCSKPVQKMNTALQCFRVPEAEAYLTPATSAGTEKFCITHQPSPLKALVAEETPCIRSWQWKMPLSNFDLYRPITMTYPDDDYLFEDSPVFYHETSLKHRSGTAVWKNLSFINSQEVFRWERVFCETLTMTLEILKKQTAKAQENVATRLGPPERVSQTDSGTAVLWTDHEWPVSYFIEEMKNRYIKQFGLPRYLITDEGLMRFLRTRETIRSMSAIKYQVTDEQRLLGKNDEVTYQASLGFTSKPMIQDVRRFTPLICNCSPYEWYKATAGEEFVFRPTLWDPHHPYAEIETTTTYTLEPKVPWLTWNHTRKAFVGVPPRKMIPPFEEVDDVMMSSYVESTEDEDLDLTVVAFSFLTLPQRVQYERTIKASATIHIQPSRQAIQAEAVRYRDTSNIAQLRSDEQKISPGVDTLDGRDSKEIAASELGTQSGL